MNIVLNKLDTNRGRSRMGEEPGKLFIGAVNGEVTKEQFQAFFEKFGEVSDIVLMMDNETHRNKGFGFVTFKDPACATKVLSSPVPLKLNGRTIDPKPSVQRGQPPPASRVPHNKSLDKKVFVGGISQSTNEDGLRNFFNSSNFMVKEVVLMHDNLTLKSRGFGFVTFHDDATVESVCRQRFFNIDNKTVECKKAEPRSKNDMGGQGGGPGGPGGNFNQMQRGGPPGGGPNMGGGGYNQGWNQSPNPNYGNNQFGQGGANYGPQGGWGGQPQQPQMGNYGQQPQQQQGFGQQSGQMPNQGGFGGQYNNGSASYNQQRAQPQQGGYGYNQQQQQPQQQQQQPTQQQQPQQQQQQQQQQPNYGSPQNYSNYGSYGQQQQQQPRQQQPQPEPYSNQAPAQTNQGYSASNYAGQAQGNYAPNGNMGNYPQEASGYGPQRVNYSTPAQTNFNQPQGGYGGDVSGGFPAQQPQQQQPQQQQQQPQQNYAPQQDNTNDMYGGAPQAAGNFARGGNNAALPFHPYRR